MWLYRTLYAGHSFFFNKRRHSVFQQNLHLMALAEAALDERRFRERVLADIESGRRAGARGTPTFFIDGERLEGPWRELARIVPARFRSASAASPDRGYQAGT